MGDTCRLQCERKCQVWQLALGGEAPTKGHSHLPCLPGGGTPGGGLTGRTYLGGCRSACTGSVTHPVEHLYPAARMRQWFFDTKEWFLDGMLVMKPKNQTKSASYYCLPFPRPTMRLPGSARGGRPRLVEVHHVHPLPDPGVMQDTTGLPVDGTRTEHSAEQDQARAADGSNATQSPLFHPPRSTPSADEAQPQPPPENGQPEAGGVAQPEEQNGFLKEKDAIMLHIDVEAGSPKVRSGTKQCPEKGGDSDDRACELTCIDYGGPSFCRSLFCRRICKGTGCCPCVPPEWKFRVRKGFAVFFTRTAGACLCLSSSCAALSFCLRKVARTVDALASTAVDVKELPNSYVFLADMPGLKHSDVKVQIEDDTVLKISGDRRRDDGGDDDGEPEIKYVQVERSTGRLLRKFNLPVGLIDPIGISAGCQDGLLTVVVPKLAPSDSRYHPRSFDVDVRSSSTASPL